MFASWELEEDDDEGELGLDWSLARCRTDGGVLTGLFFSEELLDIIKAKEICGTCPLQEPCFEGALARREPWGVWGGRLFLNGKVLAMKRKRGRPPKNPRPGQILSA